MKRQYGRLPNLPSNLFFALLALLALWLFRRTSLSPYLGWLLTLSLITFLYYGYDKAQSQRQGWRISESTLHLLSLLGGFPGGLLGMLIFRHKTKKINFRIILLVSALIHFCLIFFNVVTI